MSSDSRAAAGRRRLDPGWVLVILLTVFAVAPLTYPGFFQAQSGFLPAFNAEHPAEAPNWGRVPDPVRGEGKLPYLLAWPFVQASSSGVVAIRWGYGLAFLLGALGSYAWTRRWLGVRGGVLAAAVYTYLPWHLSTVYVRGAYGEAWLWAFWPVILWAIDDWIAHRRLVAVALGLLAAIGTLLAQPGLALMAIPLLAGYGAVAGSGRWRSGARLVGTMGLSLLAMGVAARLVPTAEDTLAGHFLAPYQLLSAAWGYGSSGGPEPMSFQLGLAGAGLSIVAVALCLGRTDGSGEPADPARPFASAPPLRRAIWFWVVALLALVLLTLPVSALLWRISGFGAFVTYPWQPLALTGLPLAFLAGSVIRLDRRLAALPAWAGLLALVILASYPYLAPRFTQVDPGPKPVAMFAAGESESPQIMLLETEIAPPTEITPTLTLTMTWQTVQPLVEDYTVFVHALAEGDTRAAQRDTWPCDGECPTTGWEPGEIIVDRHQFDLLSDAPPGPYRLAVGFYLLETGERLAVAGREDGTVVIDVP